MEISFSMDWAYTQSMLHLMGSRSKAVIPSYPFLCWKLLIIKLMHVYLPGWAATHMDHEYLQESFMTTNRACSRVWDFSALEVTLNPNTAYVHQLTSDISPSSFTFFSLVTARHDLVFSYWLQRILFCSCSSLARWLAASNSPRSSWVIKGEECKFTHARAQCSQPSSTTIITGKFVSLLQC